MVKCRLIIKLINGNSLGNNIGIDKIAGDGHKDYVYVEKPDDNHLEELQDVIKEIFG